jgi:tetratricopeptide (TPR) repeat protein
MARPLFEQYKDALRRGHVALLGDELEAALGAYREAASLVPDRPLPYLSMGSVLQRLGRSEDAVEAYDRAISLAPDDAAAVAARASVVAGLASAARLAALAEPSAPAEPQPAAELEPTSEPAPQGVGAQPAQPDPRVEASIEADADALDQMRAAIDAAGVPEAVDEPEDGGGPSTDDPVASVAPGGTMTPDDATAPDGSAWPAIDLPSPPPPPLVGPPPDPAVLQAEADALLDGGDDHGARDLLLTAVTVHRDAGRLDAAIDSCLQLLAIAPGDPRVHLAIANLQLDRGWRPVATEKIELLLRLTSLSGDAQAEADVHLLAADRLREESPARLDARRRGLPTP